MFVGHYGPAAAGANGHIKLWHCFVAVQLLDILWGPFILLGVEHARIVPNFTASNHFDLYDMPYTHSLLMALVWSVIAGWVYGKLKPGAGAKAAMVIGALVFSHWVFDFVTHKPDLALWPTFGVLPESAKIGLGVWDNRPLSFGLEVGLYLAGLIYYWVRSQAKSMLGRISPALLLAVGLAAQYYGNWTPAPEGVSETAYDAAIGAIVSYVIFAALAGFVDATRRFPSQLRADKR